MQHRLATFTLLTSLAATLSACGDSGPGGSPGDPAPIASIDVTAPATSLAPGGTLQLTAVARDADGRVVTGRALAWSASQPALATVSASGRVTALAPGEVVIAAEADDVVGGLLLVIDDPAADVATLALEPAGTLTLTAGATAVITATARDANGELVEDAAIAWATDDDGVAQVSAAGQVTALAPGATWITAAAGDASAQLRVIVEDDPTAVATVAFAEPGPLPLVPGDGHRLQARAYTAAGELVEGRPVTWSTNAAAVVTVDPSGFAEAQGHGTALVTATIDGRAATIEVIVSPVAWIGVTPGEAVLFASEALPLRAALADAQAAPLVYPIAWTSDRPAVATVDGAGRVRAVSVGVATITATAGGRRASARVAVAPQGVDALTAIDGQALPAELYRTVQPGPGGEPITERIVIDSGAFFVSTVAREYHLTLWGLSYRDGQDPVLTSFMHQGTVEWDAATGRTRYLSDEGFDELHGELQPDGSHRISFPLFGGAVTRALTFARE